MISTIQVKKRSNDWRFLILEHSFFSIICLAGEKARNILRVRSYNTSSSYWSFVNFYFIGSLIILNYFSELFDEFSDDLVFFLENVLLNGVVRWRHDLCKTTR